MTLHPYRCQTCPKVIWTKFKPERRDRIQTYCTNCKTQSWHIYINRYDIHPKCHKFCIDFCDHPNIHIDNLETELHPCKRYHNEDRSESI